MEMAGNSEEISVPDSVKDVLEYEGYVQENGWSDSAKKWSNYRNDRKKICH